MILFCILIGSRDGKIIGGYDASPRSHPYLVSLQMRFIWIRMRICSGSLLNERWVGMGFTSVNKILDSNFHTQPDSGYFAKQSASTQVFPLGGGCLS